MSNGSVSTKMIIRKENGIYKGNLKKRGYSSNLIDKQFQKVDKLEREDLLKYNQPKQSDRVPLVLTYTDALPNIHTILRKHFGHFVQFIRNEAGFSAATDGCIS